MSRELALLVGTAATIGFVHTLLGPDHYLPFIAIAKARDWTARRTFLVTAACGVGHVLSSVVLGFVGIALGVALFKLEAIESFRGDAAAWLLIAFGFTYLVWGLHKAFRGKSHEHAHSHADGLVHAHSHTHAGDHVHVHGASTKSVTPWVLFLIFVFGPCEPLIPILMFPAARGSMASVALVAGVFAVATIGTMLGVVMVAHVGLSKVRFPSLERFGHALAAATILLCGGAIKFLGL